MSDGGGNGVTGGGRKRPAGVRLSVSAPRDADIAALSDAAFRLWITGVCWCVEHGTDGWIDASTLSFWRISRRSRAAPIAELTGGPDPLWQVVEGGYMVRGYLDYQYSSAERAEHREANAARQARWRGQSRAPAVTITPDPLDLVAARNGVTEESVTALVTRQVVKDLKQDPLEGSLAVNPGGAAMRL